MRKTFMGVLVVLIILVLSLSLVSAQGDQAEIEEVFTQTEEIRGLEASPDIKVNYLTREQLKQRMIEDFEKDNPEEEIQDAEDIMVLLGFIEPDLDLKDFYIDLLTEQIAGFYDPEDDSLYLISEDETMSAADRYTLSHEIVHYLQDMNFDLDRPPFDDPEDAVEETDDDASFAATCLVEGDAVTASDIWLSEYFTEEDWMEYMLEGESYSMGVFNSAPDYIKDSLLFPYKEGQEFADYIYEDGGFGALDKAYSDPPVSTEQIYHPEKYVKGEKAVKVELEDISSKLGEGWELDYDDVLGEFDVKQLYQPYLSGRKTEKAAEGWGGNRYHYYSNGDGDKVLVQSYTWDSEKDAQEFASAYVEYVQARFEDEVKEESPMGAWSVWSTDDYRLGLKRDGANTYLVQSTQEEPLSTAVAALGEEGDVIDEGALAGDEEEGSGEDTNLTWLVAGLVVGLLVLGIVLVIVMFVMYRRPPAPPAQPPAGTYGPYYYPPGGGSGGVAGPEAGGAPGGGPPEPPAPPAYQPPPPPPSQVPPPPGTIPPGQTPDS